VVAIDGDGRLLILVTRENATLLGMSAFLFAASSKLDVRSALNLDGDVVSGLIVAAGSTLTTVGSSDSLVASAIGIFKAE
jgi:hypothetical protein